MISDELATEHTSHNRIAACLSFQWQTTFQSTRWPASTGSCHGGWQSPQPSVLIRSPQW